MTFATSASRSQAFELSTGTAESCRGVDMGEMCWTARRWLADSKNPPVPGVEASTNVSGDTHSALPAVSITCVSETWSARSRFGSTCTWSCRSRWP